MSNEAEELYRLLIETYRNSKIRKKIGYLRIRRVLGEFIGYQDKAEVKGRERG